MNGREIGNGNGSDVMGHPLNALGRCLIARD